MRWQRLTLDALPLCASALPVADARARTPVEPERDGVGICVDQGGAKNVPSTSLTGQALTAHPPLPAARFVPMGSPRAMVPPPDTVAVINGPALVAPNVPGWGRPKALCE